MEVASHVGDDEARSSISLTAFFSGLCSTSAADATAVEMQPPIRQDNTTSTSGSTGGGSSSISDSKSEIVTLRHHRQQRSCQSSNNPHGIDNILSSPAPAAASLVRNLQFWQDLKRLKLFENESDSSSLKHKEEERLLDNIRTTSGN